MCEKGLPSTRDSWEIEEDLRAFQRVRTILKDKDRLDDLKKLAKDKTVETEANALIVDGDLQSALGL